LDLKTFRETAISPSMLRSFHFCQAQPIVMKRARDLGLRVRSMKIGASRHETDLSWHTDLLDLEPVEVYTVEEALGYLEDTVRGALRKKLVLANTFRVRTFASIVPELIPGRGLLGYPDAVDCTGREPIVVEAKYSMPPLRGGVWSGHKLQLLGYLAGIAELGWVEPVGRVVYWNQVAEVCYTKEEESYLHQVARRLDAVEKGVVLEPSYRCGDCVWWEVCLWQR
jgi:CRISPR/Cas system-associated exonuclease Cas4 (RecB family)